MNTVMINRLILKDVYFSRLITILFIVGSVLAILAVVYGNDIGAMIGGIGLVAGIMSFGIFIVMHCIVNERKHMTLPFIMSLPVSFREYTIAKMVFATGTFFIPWLLVSAACIIISYQWDAVPNGSIPFFTLLLVELLLAHIIIMCVAIVTESEGWTVLAMAICNTCFSVFLFSIRKLEGIGGFVDGDRAVWTGHALAVLGGELSAIIVLIAGTYYLQSRKDDFL